MSETTQNDLVQKEAPNLNYLVEVQHNMRELGLRTRGDYSKDGNNIALVAKATLDASAGLAIGTHGLGVNIPRNAIIKKVWYDVVTTFTSAGADAGTIALQAESADDIVAAVAISDVGNPWDAGLHDGIQDGAAANMVKTTDTRELTAVVAVQALTAGKLALFVEYVPSVL